ncbi:MAG: hypothetical protein NTZ22_01610, partial [Hyphomicrobiales bacterium]|nr:hypothetical protein [Hyphomicrobiales bacterium]
MPTEQHQERCLLLALNGFDVIMLSGIQDVIKSCAEGRPTCVIIDTPIHDSLAGVQSIQTLAVMPELNGVRFILSVTHSAPESLRVAVSENFRDLIPISLLPVQWLQRVQYATAAKPTDFNAPLCEISMNQVAVALAPARVIWISETHIRIECRGNQKPGTSLQISGPMSTAFGVSHVSLTVESVHKDQLMYRFSQALVCKWRISGTAAERASTLIRRLNTEFSDARIRAFIAVTKPETRKIIADCLKLQNFEMKVALQKSTIRILSSIAEADIQAMFEKLPGDVPVVIYAAPGSHHETFRKLVGSRPIFFESTAHAEHLQTASSRYHITPHAHVDDSHGSKAQIASQHSWSKIELHVPARLRGLNPTVGEIALPFSMGAFTLARLEAPILRKALGRDPYIKIT